MRIILRIMMLAMTVAAMILPTFADWLSMRDEREDKIKILTLLSAYEFKNRERLELLRMGEQAKTVLRDIIGENKPPFYLMERAVIVLGEVFRDRASVDLIRPLLRHSVPEVKAAAVRALRYIGDESDIPILIQMLQDSDTFVRFAAVTTLSYIGSPKALPVLKKMLNEVSIYSRPAIKRAIQMIEIWNSTQRNKELESAVLSEDRELARWAVQRIAQLGLKGALPTLRKALERVRPAHGADRLRMEVEILSAIKKLGGTLSSEELKKLEEFPPETLW